MKVLSPKELIHVCLNKTLFLIFILFDFTCSSFKSGNRKSIGGYVRNYYFSFNSEQLSWEFCCVYIM